MTLTISDGLVFGGLTLAGIGLALVAWPLVLVLAGMAVTYVGYRRTGIG